MGVWQRRQGGLGSKRSLPTTRREEPPRSVLRQIDEPERGACERWRPAGSVLAGESAQGGIAPPMNRLNSDGAGAGAAHLGRRWPKILVEQKAPQGRHQPAARTNKNIWNWS